VHRAFVGFVERGEREVTLPVAWRLADALCQDLSTLVAAHEDNPLAPD